MGINEVDTLTPNDRMDNSGMENLGPVSSVVERPAVNR